MPSRKTRTKPPLALATSGYLYVGGRIDRRIKGAPMVGQMYVEFWIPRTLRAPYPVVMIHGNWQTGTNFTGTPDDREGWAQYFVRRGHAVYVVDQVARGRSAHFSQSQGKVAEGNLKRTQQRFTAPEKENLWPQAKLHTQWPGTGQAGDPVFDQDQGRTGLFDHPTHGCPDELGAGRIQVRGRLIQEQQPRAGGNYPGQRKALLLPTRQGLS